MIPKAVAKGNWWLAASPQQCRFGQICGKMSNHPADLAPLQLRLGVLQLLAFPKTKITFEREEISDSLWDSGKYDGAVDGHWENCVISQGAYFEGDWGVTILCTVFLVSCIFISKCPYFSQCVVGYFLDRPLCIYFSGLTFGMQFLKCLTHLILK